MRGNLSPRLISGFETTPESHSLKGYGGEVNSTLLGGRGKPGGVDAVLGLAGCMR